MPHVYADTPPALPAPLPHLVGAPLLWTCVAFDYRTYQRGFLVSCVPQLHVLHPQTGVHAWDDAASGCHMHVTVLER